MRITSPFLLLFLIGFLSFPKVFSGQISSQEKDSSNVKDCEIKDVNDIMHGLFDNNKKHKKEDPQKEEKKKDKAEKTKEKKISLLLLPTISANPTNGFMLGATGTGS